MKESEKKKALIAMSGGVDSSVAAALMVQEGYECIGCTMKLLDASVTDLSEKACEISAGTEAGTASSAGPGAAGIGTAGAGSGVPDTSAPHTCCSLDDVEDARSVARKLGMPYYVFNFTSDFGEKVIDRFVRIYQAGGTPNPCIDCNRYMKFGRLFFRAQELGCDKVVTGHYARTKFDEKTGRWQLLRSKNRTKDQTYVLYAMTQEQLAHAAFPLGEFEGKEEVRQMAEHYGFVNSHKPDSQDICFVPNGKYADFIEGRTGQKAPCGDFVDEEGHVLGEHKGLIRYTIGQRRGLGLALPAPLYVQRIDTEKNQVILTPEDRLFSRRLIAEDFNWIWTPDWEKQWSMKSSGSSGRDTERPSDGKWSVLPGMVEGHDTDTPPVGYTCEVTAKPRYRAKEAEATVRVLDGGKVEILFHEPQRALTIGQAVVLYMGEKVVGGGTICEVPLDYKRGGKEFAGEIPVSTPD